MASTRNDTQTGITLDMADDYWSDVLSDGPGFAETVRDLWAVKKRINPINAAVKEYRAALMRLIKTEDTILAAGQKLRRTPDRIITYKPAVVAKQVQQRNPALYNRCRILTTNVRISDGSGRTELAINPNTMTIDRLTESLVGLKEMVNELRTTEQKHRQRLLDITDLVDTWDGTALQFIDGWKVQTATMRFSADRMAEIAPDLYDQFLVERPATVRAGTILVNEALDIDSLLNPD